MYILSVFALIAVAFILNPLGIGGMGIFLNGISFILLFVITFPILISSNLVKDFNNAFKYVISNKDISLIQLKRSLEAIELVMKTLFYAAGFITLFSFVNAMHDLADLSNLGPNLSNAILAFLYVIFINLLLLPIRYRLKIMIINFANE